MANVPQKEETRDMQKELVLTTKGGDSTDLNEKKCSYVDWNYTTAFSPYSEMRNKEKYS